MSTALVSSTTFCDIFIKSNSLGAKINMKPFMDRKAVGSPISFANVRRNSGSSTTTTTTAAMNLNKLNNTSTFCLNDAASLLTSNQGHRKLDRSLSEPVERSSSSALAQQQQQQQRNNQGNSSRYKTELCRPFEENGTCKYGDKCQFAHGAHELRTLARHPKYKTELCRTFHTAGFCPYGPRCHFIHNADESRKSVGSSSPPPSSMLNRDAPRPKALSIGSYSLGSTGDSPPSSLSESPTSMGSFFDGPFNTGFSSSNPVTPTITANGSFNYCKDINTAAFGSLHLNKQQMQHLNRALNQISLTVLNQRNLNFESVDSVFPEPTPVINVPGPEAPPSPVGSLISELDNQNSNGSPTCTSPLDVSRNLRLPIFSQLSISDD